MGFVLIILGTLMWSIDTLIRYPLLAHVQASQIVLIEHLILSLIFVPLLAYKTRFNSALIAKFKKPNVLMAFFIIGALGSALCTIAFTKAFTLINPSLVILLQKLQPIFVVLFSALYLKEKISKSFWLYGTLGFIGAFIISAPDIFAGLASSDLANQNALGYFLAIVSVLGWSLSTVFGKKLQNLYFNETEILTGRFFTGFIALIIYFLFNQSLLASVTDITPANHFKILVMVLLSGLIGMSLYYRGLSRVKAHYASIAELFFPLSAVTINWIFLNQPLKPLQVVGALILIGSSIMLNRERFKA